MSTSMCKQREILAEYRARVPRGSQNQILSGPGAWPTRATKTDFILEPGARGEAKINSFPGLVGLSVGRRLAGQGHQNGLDFEARGPRGSQNKVLSGPGDQSGVAKTKYVSVVFVSPKAARG